MKRKRFEILEGLPPYGPMFVSITIEEEQFTSEGFVVRFYRSDGSDWVANFKPGWSDYSNVFDYPERDLIIVIAGGLGYIMNPDNEKPKISFGLSINNVIKNKDGSLLCSDDTNLIFLDNNTGGVWLSDRISWDGIRNLEWHENSVTGQSYDPTNSIIPWCEFSVDLKVKKVKGGSFQESLKNNPKFRINKNELSQELKQSWWGVGDDAN